MPNDTFMLDVTGEGLKNKGSNAIIKEGPGDGFETEVDDFFDFVLIESDDMKEKKKQK